MQEKQALVLEVLKQENTLKMCLSEREELVSTLRHYSQSAVSFKEIEGLCQEIVGILNKANPSGVLNAAAINSLKKSGLILWEHLLSRQVKEKLRLEKERDLILSLDEELINIPWELLYDGNNFLSLNFNLGRLVRTKKEANPVQYRSSPGILKMLILANPTNDLKSAYLEGINIRNQFDRRRSNVRIDFKSTRIDKLYVKKNLCDYDIVHFAGHCEYLSDEPKESGWVFSDERFTVNDILNMGSSMSLPNLVFSNACHSAKTESEAVDEDYQEKSFSLAQAFLFSGVRHYIGAIRRLEDPVSFIFSKEFYSRLINGRSVGESMRLARLKLIQEFGVNAIYWASYLLYGDPNFVLFRPKPVARPDAKKKGIELAQRVLLPAGLGFIGAAIAVYLYMQLPNINPTNYYLYQKAQKQFLKGANAQVLSTGEQIINKNPLFLGIYPLLAETHYRRGNMQEALKYYFDYALFSEKKKDPVNLNSAYIGIGWTYHRTGEHKKAQEFYDKALTLSRKNRDLANEADVLGKIAVWQIDMNNNDLALELLTKSAEINRQKKHIYKHKYNLACDYFNLGLLFTNKEDYITAKEFYDKSFKLFSELKLKHELSDYYFNIGEIYVFEKEYLKAMDNYQKGLQIDQEQGNKPFIAADFNMIGELHMAMDNLAEAEKCFNQALSGASEIDFKPEIALANANLGSLYKKLGKKNKAREFFRAAQEIYRLEDEAKYQQIKQELLDMSAI